MKIKKLVALLLTATLVLSFATPLLAGAEGTDYGIVPYSVYPITVDGIKDDAYDNALSFTVSGIVYGVDTGISADVSLLYREDSLYVFVMVHDPDIITPDAERSKNPWDYDNVELFIDYSGNSYSDAYSAGTGVDTLDQCVQYRVDVSGYPSVYGFADSGDSWSAYGYDESAIGSKADSQGRYASAFFSYAGNFASDIYTVEYCIPLTNTHLAWGTETIEAGDKFGLSLQVTDFYTDCTETTVSRIDGLKGWAWDAHTWPTFTLGEIADYYYPSEKTVEMVKTDSEIVIDGVKDSAYNDSNVIDAVEQNLDTWDESPCNTNGQVWTLWDDEFIYIYAECHDSDVYTCHNGDSSTSGRIWAGDHMAIFIDFDYNRTIAYEYSYDDNGDNIAYINIAPDGGADFFQPYHLVQEGSSYNSLVKTYANWDSDAGIIYYEARIPIPSDIVSLSAGSKIGLEVNFTNATTETAKRVGNVSWSPFGAKIYKWTHVAGTAVLYEACSKGHEGPFTFGDEIICNTCDGKIVLPETDNLGTVPYSVVAPTVDGVKDSIYDNAVIIPVNKVIRGEDTGLEANASVVFSDDYLYVLMEVNDPDIVVPDEAHSKNPWDYENVEFFIDYSGKSFSETAGSANDYLAAAVQYRTDISGFQSVYGFNANSRSWSAYGSGADSAGSSADSKGRYAVDFFDAAAKIDGNTYTIEYKIPLTNTSLDWGTETIEYGDTFGINIQITDFVTGSSDTSGYCIIDGLNWAWDAQDWPKLTLGQGCHILEKHEGVEATYTSEGMEPYYECTLCGKLFEDAEGTVETTLDALVIPKRACDHDLTVHNGTDATCSATGIITSTGARVYYYCSECDLYFSNTDRDEIVTLIVEPIDPSNHYVNENAAKEATYTSAGNVLYYECTLCGKLFSDAECTVETDRKSVIIPQKIQVSETGAVEIASEEISEVVVKDETTNTVTIPLDNTVDQETGEVVAVATVTLPVEVVTEATDSNASLELKTADSSIKLDNQALATVAEAVNASPESTVELKVQVGTAEDSLKEEQVSAVESLNVEDVAAVVSASIVVDGKTIGSESDGGFNGGSVTISVPFVPSEGSGSDYSILYVPDEGEPVIVDAKYDNGTKCLVFTTEHLSEYAIVKLHKCNYTELKLNNVYHWYVCSCGEHSEYVAHDYILKYDEDNHWYECSGCGDFNNKVAHISNGEATETTAEICTECGYVIKNVVGHSCESLLTKVPAVKATCTVDGNIEYYECECGRLYKDSGAASEIFDEKSVVIAAIGHVDDDKDNFCDTCDEVLHVCAYKVFSDSYNHWFECSCGDILGVSSHIESGWIVDAEAGAFEAGSRHTECSVCGIIMKAESIEMLGWYDKNMFIQSGIINKKLFKIVATTSEGGTISNYGETIVNYGSVMNYIITPSDGYRIDAVYINGKKIGVVDKYKFNYIKSSASIYVEFEEIQ